MRILSTLLGAALAFGATGCGPEPMDTVAFDDGSQAVPGGRRSTAALPYPDAPYGFSIGSTIPNLDFMGFPDAAAVDYDPSKLSPISLADYYDPLDAQGNNGGTRVLHINVTAGWCGYCRAEHTGGSFNGVKYARPISEEADERAPFGYRYLEIFAQDSQANPAQLKDLVAWASRYELYHPIAIDSAEKINALRRSFGFFPANIIIDTRTMRILSVVDGGSPGAIWRAVDTALED